MFQHKYGCLSNEQDDYIWFTFSWESKINFMTPFFMDKVFIHKKLFLIARSSGVSCTHLIGFRKMKNLLWSHIVDLNLVHELLDWCTVIPLRHFSLNSLKGFYFGIHLRIRSFWNFAKPQSYPWVQKNIFTHILGLIFVISCSYSDIQGATIVRELEIRKLFGIVMLWNLF